MTDYRRFQRGSGAFACRSCGKLTRDTGHDEGGVRLCRFCNEQALVENYINDCIDDHREAVKLMADLDAAKTLKDIDDVMERAEKAAGQRK